MKTGCARMRSVRSRIYTSFAYALIHSLIVLTAEAQDLPVEPTSKRESPEPAQSIPNLAEAPIEDIGNGRYRVGLVTLDANKKNISFPTVVNMQSDLVEYLIVSETGKVHESILRTKAEPLHLHIAFLLLGAKGSMSADPAIFYDPKAEVPGDPVTVRAQWTVDGRPFSKPIEYFAKNIENGKPVTEGPWKYNGSQMVDNAFVAQQEGSFVSMMADPYALINNPRAGRENDEIWTADETRVPEVETPVTVTIQLIELKPAENKETTEDN